MTDLQVKLYNLMLFVNLCIVLFKQNKYICKNRTKNWQNYVFIKNSGEAVKISPLFCLFLTVEATAGAFTLTLLCIGTANTFFAPFLSTDKINHDTRHNSRKNYNNNCIFHNNHPAQVIILPLHTPFHFSSFCWC